VKKVEFSNESNTVSKVRNPIEFSPAAAESQPEEGLYIDGISKLNLEFDFAKRIPSHDRRLLKIPNE
jgi:hypothetical protein